MNDRLQTWAQIVMGMAFCLPFALKNYPLPVVFLAATLGVVIASKVARS